MEFLTKLATLVGISDVALLTSALLLFFCVYLIQRQIKDKTKKTSFIVSAIIVIGLFVYFFGFVITVEKNEVTQQAGGWLSEYQNMARQQVPNYEELISNTIYYDYDNQIIVDIANQIESQVSNSYDAAAKAVEIVYARTSYVYGEPDNACFDGTAPEIITSGKGQCDTQSIAVVSILRKMGIPAVPTGGCIVPNPDCRLQAIIPSPTAPRYTHLLTIQGGQKTFSRGYSRAGGLHAWPVAWTVEKGWVPLEATAGVVADTKCYYYHVEIYPTNTQKEDICVSKNERYALACMNNNLQELDQEGLGLVNMVSP